MARKCLCDTLLDSEFVRHRLLLVPAAARWIWLSLAKAMSVSDDPGVLRFGCGLGLSSLVSRLVSVSETEAETELENLIAVGLLVRRGQDEIALPEVAPARSRRAEAARINGLKGGRPPKRQQDDAQRSMTMVLPGGRPDAQAGNPTASRSVSPVSTTTVDVSDISSSHQKPTAAPPKPTDGQPADIDAIGREAAEAAGLDHAAGQHTWGIVGQWLALGATRELILEVIEERRPAARQVWSLRYFDRAVREAADQARRTPAPSAMSQAEREARRRWNDDVNTWQDGHRRGAMPDLQAYLARAGVVAGATVAA